MRNNPYTIPLDKTTTGLFIGQDALFQEIQTILDQQTTGTVRSILLYGAPKVGKTAVLKQVTNGRLGKHHFPIYVDLSQIALDSLSSFYWDLAHTIYQIVQKKHGIHLPDFNQTTFVAAPLQAFFLQLIKPLSTHFPNQALLLLFDNASHLIEHIQTKTFSADVIVDLQNQLHQANHASSLFAVTSPTPTLQDVKDLPFYQWIHPLPVNNLTENETIQFVCDPVGYTVVKEVARYIFELTQGHPHYLRQLCSTLYDYQQENDLSHITVADVAAVNKSIDKKQWKTAVSPSTPAYAIQPNPRLAQTIHTVTHQAKWYQQPLFVGLGVFVLVTLLVTLIPILIRQQNQSSANALAAVTATSEGIVASLPQESAIPIEATSTATQEPLPPPTSTPSPTETPTLTPTATPTPTITPEAYPNLIIRDQDGMVMVYIPADTFIMGSAENDPLSAADEQPQRDVRMDAFYIDKFEVTVEQYAAFLNRLGDYYRACDNVDCTLPRDIAGYTNYLMEQDLGDGTVQYIPMTGFSNYPANHISWHGANNYCQSVGARLPTEAEWEYAARGTDGRLYPWGNSAPDETKAIFQSENFDNMKPVDALPEGASPFGVLNMAGSVWEWTADWYEEFYYSEAPNINPPGPETGLARVVRGGGWPFNNQADRIRSTNRLSLAPEFISSTVGFRCAKSP